MAHLYADIPELTTKFNVVVVNGEEVDQAQIEGKLVHITYGNGEEKLFAGHREVEVQLRSPIRKHTSRKHHKNTKTVVLRPGKTERDRQKGKIKQWEENRAKRAEENRQAARNKGAGTKKQR